MALPQVDHSRTLALLSDQLIDAGSNNWAVAPGKTNTGRPILANDPHRGHAVPSLRYIAHLVAPGINVIGAGEPGLPGISIGHNEKYRIWPNNFLNRSRGFDCLRPTAQG